MKKHTAVKENTISIIIEALEDKKGLDIRAFDVRGISDMWNYIVVATGTSYTHVNTLYDNVQCELEKHGESVVHKENEGDSTWAVIDAGDVLVHIFDRDTRVYYAIEKLWGEKEISLKMRTTKE